MEWEVPENIEKAQASMEFILQGCKCKGGCSTRRCSCQRKDRICGPSCQCINCMNTPTTPPTTQAYVSELETLDLLTEEQDQEEAEYVNDSDDDDLDDLRAEREMEEIMCFVFGEDSDEDGEDEPETVD